MWTCLRVWKKAAALVLALDQADVPCPVIPECTRTQIVQLAQANLDLGKNENIKTGDRNFCLLFLFE